MRWLIELGPISRTAFHRLLSGVYFKRLGAGSRVYGPQHFHRPLMDIRIGKSAMIGRDIFWQVARGAHVAMGDHGSINSHCIIVSSEAIDIGDNVAIAEFVSIRDQEHHFHPDHGVRGQGFRVAPIIIEDNCWIGRGVYIGPGSHIRAGSIVAANSVVRGEYPPNSLIAGAPAVVKKSLS